MVVPFGKYGKVESNLFTWVPGENQSHSLEIVQIISFC